MAHSNLCCQEQGVVLHLSQNVNLTIIFLKVFDSDHPKIVFIRLPVRLLRVPLYQQVVVLNFLQNVRHFSGLMGDFSVHLSYGRRRWVKLDQSWLDITLDQKFTPVSMCPTGTRMKESCTGFSGLAIRQSSYRPVEK